MRTNAPDPKIMGGLWTTKSANYRYGQESKFTPPPQKMLIATTNDDRKKQKSRPSPFLIGSLRVIGSLL